MTDLMNNFENEKARHEEEDILINVGINGAHDNFTRILDEYSSVSSCYKDDNDLIGRVQFSHLFRNFADCLFERGWTIEDLNKQILLVQKSRSND